jgi:hypothetical protein
MDDDTARSALSGKRRPRRALGVRLGIAGLAAIGLLAAACGGGSKDPAAAGAGRTTTTAAPSAAASSGQSGQISQTQQLLELAQCVRSHGVPSFPDPSPTDGILGMIENAAASGVNPQAPAFQAAWKACKKYGPGANLTPAQSAAQNAKGVEESQCMRSHGVPNFPDPTTGPVGEQVINLRGTGIDPGSPTAVQAAASKACAKLFPGSK